jgi:hypothetical protein
MKLNHPQKSTLGTALLVYMVFMVFLITLFPFDFRIPAKIQIKILTNGKHCSFYPDRVSFQIKPQTGQRCFMPEPAFFGSFVKHLN